MFRNSLGYASAYTFNESVRYNQKIQLYINSDVGHFMLKHETHDNLSVKDFADQIKSTLTSNKVRVLSFKGIFEYFRKYLKSMLMSS